ncbi:MAG TPA: NADH:flavin oxidoreductase/NADH oxidase [Rhizomicrobium sp.]|jgi:2,4-dienoyl-CoA reductase-like NADH-dependent reductase (Old Yellow Enzyme family)|nr:NADH:flavin oxidoreductase/NADH oxidase [Rhizomicrobium sp.]
MASLFDPFTLKSVTLKNRIAVAPMCQYSAEDGVIDDWHLIHLGSHAIGGAGLIVAEATAVAPEGRITPGCSGIWNDAQAGKWPRVIAFLKKHGAVPGMQIAHAGRKAAANRPWEGDDHMKPDDPRAWQPIGPSANAFGANLPRVPAAMTKEDIRRVQGEFVAAARRALAAGFELLELHFAHGYLAQSFFSPIANRRTDEYGGSFENRIRFPMETFEAVRAVWPEHLPLTARLGISDFTDDSQTVEESIDLIRRFKAGGLDMIDVSVGFNTPDISKIPWGPAFMAPYCERIRRETGIATACGWSITEAAEADGIVRKGQADIIMLARAMLRDPNWPYHAARALGRKDAATMLPSQYAYWLRGG